MDKIMLKLIPRLLLAVAIGLGFQSTANAISPQGLELEISSGQKITIIDIRANVIYRKSHIQNAINIPVSIIERKNLPRLGRVVVYGEGIDVSLLEQAVASLNAKPGIQAEPLDGGFAAWSARNNVVQRETGLSVRHTKTLSYQALQKMADRYDVLLLVDLRMGTQQDSLANHFPNLRVFDPIDTIQDDVSDPDVNSYILETIPRGNQEVLILIDDGNGLSDKVAAKLHAAGVKRLAILVGGQRALRTRGEVNQQVRKTGD